MTDTLFIDATLGAAMGALHSGPLYPLRHRAPQSGPKDYTKDARHGQDDQDAWVAGEQRCLRHMPSMSGAAKGHSETHVSDVTFSQHSHRGDHPRLRRRTDLPERHRPLMGQHAILGRSPQDGPDITLWTP